jgi:hypothetical protein
MLLVYNKYYINVTASVYSCTFANTLVIVVMNMLVS